MLNKAFISYRIATGLLADLSDDEFPTQLRGWNSGILNLPTNSTHFGYVWKGEPVLKTDVGTFTLQAGMYFSAPGPATLLGDGQGIICTCIGYFGMFNIGGPIESRGRLLYIDGCRDSLLIPPLMRGEPCLNALYFPAGINQTPHTHPSLRAGMVVSGKGECVTSEKILPLEPGQAFVIPADGLHSFRTKEKPMVVIAYHPDSDCGPTHEVHPMLTRTMVDGISASKLEEIRTRG